MGKRALPASLRPSAPWWHWSRPVGLLRRLTRLVPEEYIHEREIAVLHGTVSWTREDRVEFVDRVTFTLVERGAHRCVRAVVTASFPGHPHRPSKEQLEEALDESPIRSLAMEFLDSSVRRSEERWRELGRHSMEVADEDTRRWLEGRPPRSRERRDGLARGQAGLSIPKPRGSTPRPGTNFDLLTFALRLACVVMLYIAFDAMVTRGYYLVAALDALGFIMMFGSLGRDLGRWLGDK